MSQFHFACSQRTSNGRGKEIWDRWPRQPERSSSLPGNLHPPLKPEQGQDKGHFFTLTKSYHDLARLVLDPRFPVLPSPGTPPTAWAQQSGLPGASWWQSRASPLLAFSSGSTWLRLKTRWDGTPSSEVGSEEALSFLRHLSQKWKPNDCHNLLTGGAIYCGVLHLVFSALCKWCKWLCVYVVKCHLYVICMHFPLFQGRCCQLLSGILTWFDLDKWLASSLCFCWGFCLS